MMDGSWSFSCNEATTREITRQGKRQIGSRERTSWQRWRKSELLQLPRARRDLPFLPFLWAIQRNVRSRRPVLTIIEAGIIRLVAWIRRYGLGLRRHLNSEGGTLSSSDTPA